MWRFEPGVPDRPPVLDHATLTAMPLTAESKQLSRELRRRGWAFVGPTTVYSAMQAVGIVNDHLEECFARAEVERDRNLFTRPDR